MPTRLRWAVPLLALPALLAAAGASAAQEVRGRVVDDGSGRAVGRAQVVLMDAGEEVVARATADRGGLFTLRAPGPGVYSLRAERVGYQPTRTGGVDLGDATVLEVTVRLAEGAVAVAPLRVVARREAARERGLERHGFYDRRSAGLGAFLDRQFIEGRRAQLATQLFRGVLGVTLVQLRDGSTALMMSRARCAPILWVDGVRMGTGERLDDLVEPEDVEGIEVYRGPSEIPFEFGGTGARCGAVVIWTRMGTR